MSIWDDVLQKAGDWFRNNQGSSDSGGGPGDSTSQAPVGCQLPDGSRDPQCDKKLGVDRQGAPAMRHALRGYSPWESNTLLRLARRGKLGMSATGFTPEGSVGLNATLGHNLGGPKYQPGQEIAWQHDDPAAQEAALGGVEQRGVEHRARAVQAANLRKLARQRAGAG